MYDIPVERLCIRSTHGPETRFGAWAFDMVRLGQSISEFDAAPPITLALSLPAGAFAGPLIAAGYVVGRSTGSSQSAGAGDDVDPEKIHLFRDLCALPQGTAVRLRKGNKVVRSIFDGIKVDYGREWAIIRFQPESKGSGRELIDEAQVDRVLFDRELRVSQVERQLGRETSVDLGLARAFFSDDAVLHRHFFRLSADCALIGRVNRLTEEILSELRAYTYGGKVVDGTLQDILRVSRFLPSMESSRGKIFKENGEHRDIKKYSPSLAVFCTASAYINVSPSVPAAHHAALLTSTERHFSDAMDVLNHSFLNKLKEISGDGWTVPNGVPAMAFRRRNAEMQ